MQNICRLKHVILTSIGSLEDAYLQLYTAKKCSKRPMLDYLQTAGISKTPKTLCLN